MHVFIRSRALYPSIHPFTFGEIQQQVAVERGARLFTMPPQAQDVGVGVGLALEHAVIGIIHQNGSSEPDFDRMAEQGQAGSRRLLRVEIPGPVRKALGVEKMIVIVLAWLIVVAIRHFALEDRIVVVFHHHEPCAAGVQQGAIGSGTSRSEAELEVHSEELSSGVGISVQHSLYLRHRAIRSCWFWQTIVIVMGNSDG